MRSGQFIDVSSAPIICAAPDGSRATVTNADQIRVFGPGTEFFDRIVVDQSGGAFAPGKAAEVDGRMTSSRSR